MSKFVHLHVHSQYSLLDGQAAIPAIVDKAIADGMPAVAITDHGVMYGIKEFTNYVNKKNKAVKEEIKDLEKRLKEAENGNPQEGDGVDELKAKIGQAKARIFTPIIGCEMYVAEKSNTEHVDKHDTGRHLVVLAKNKTGYRNLIKLVSESWTRGFYQHPRTDKESIAAHREGLIISSACLGGEIPRLLDAGRIEEADASVKWWKETMGDDYYLELMRHKATVPRANHEVYEKQKAIEPEIIRLARKYNIKLIATNDSHFVNEADAEAHDHLICISTKKDLNDEKRMLYSKQEWFKTTDEMSALFADMPEVIENTLEIAAKVETYSIDHEPIMPNFAIPAEFGSEEEYRSRLTEKDLFDEFTRDEHGNVVLSQEKAEAKIEKLGGYEKLYRIKFEADYLRKLAYEGAAKRYGTPLSQEVDERIKFELHIMKTMGFPGYFLIVQDFIRAGREQLGVSIGPGRGSAAGSVVAYCLGITQIDPLKYDLLFERFLNPDRISLPDIDVDFDDDGRAKVLKYVTEKYGEPNVAHIITYGTMAAKSAIKDVARVEHLPIPESNRLTKLIPAHMPMKDGKELKPTLANCLKYVDAMKSELENTNPQVRNTLEYARELEGNVRNVGVHACGVIICRDPVSDWVPVSTAEDKEEGKLLVTQYEGSVIEDTGLIKMDFLGLKTLSIIKTAVANIHNARGIDVDIDTIPIDDKVTYDLYSQGHTIGTFQFESAGMQKYLRELKPSKFEDLIAMNALYRPGPMDNIPEFIDRKQGRKPITYDIPVMEKYLKDTYGITVYQEQVMLLSRLLAGFTRGQSDTLRKAMGKKQIDKMNELEVLFYEGGEKNGHPKDVLGKIWEEWKKFASYAFNKSHAACYSWVAYQTAYLKAHYPAEYMAAVMTSAQTDINRVRELMDDCKKQGVEVAAPSVNDSDMDFSVDKDGKIRFGLQAISGMGEAASAVIIAEREKNGPYKDIFDFLKRVDMHSVNKKNLEVLVKAGAFDGVGEMHRAQYFYKENQLETTPTYLDMLVRWAIRRQDGASSNQMSIFSMSEELAEEEHPPVPAAEPWSNIERCRHEKEVISTYLSGHPLDDYKYEMQMMANVSCEQLGNLDALVGREVRFAGMVSGAREMVSGKGVPFGSMTIDDYSGSYEMKLYGDEYSDFKGFFTNDTFVFCRGKVSARRYTDKTGNERNYVSLKVLAMMNLAGVFDKYSSRLCFKIDINDIDEAFCKAIEKIGKKHKGSVPLQAQVIDPSQKLSLTMGATDLRVKVRDAIPELEQLKGVYDIKPTLKS